jgi:hypothetical protein
MTSLTPVKTLSPNTVTLGVSVSTWIWDRGKIQFIAIALPSDFYPLTPQYPLYYQKNKYFRLLTCEQVFLFIYYLFMLLFIYLLLPQTYRDSLWVKKWLASSVEWINPRSSRGWASKEKLSSDFPCSALRRIPVCAIIKGSDIGRIWAWDIQDPHISYNSSQPFVGKPLLDS